MQLTLYIPNRSTALGEDGDELPVRSERDILKAGFAVARSVRAWLKAMPFVPSTVDLHYNIYATVEPEEENKPARGAKDQELLERERAEDPRAAAPRRRSKKGKGKKHG